MPYDSKAQQRYMHAAAKRGEIKKSVVEERDRTTDFKKLPERKKPRRGNIGRMLRERMG